MPSMSKMKVALVTAALAAAQRKKPPPDSVSCGEPCFLAPDNQWKPEDLQPYFLCLENCCADYDPSRLFDGMTCEDIIGFAADQGGCEADLFDFGLHHIQRGTFIKKVCPQTCQVCEQLPGELKECDATVPDGDLKGYLRCLGSSCTDYDSTQIFTTAGRCADLQWLGCDKPLTDIPGIMFGEHECTTSHEYDDFGPGACRSTAGGRLHFDLGFYRNGPGGSNDGTTPAQCRAACDAEPSCTGYVVGTEGPPDEHGYCKVQTSVRNAPAGWELHPSKYSDVTATNGRAQFHCYGVNQAAEAPGRCVPVDATLAWACPATCGVCKVNPEATPPPCSPVGDCHGHGSTTDEDSSDGCDCTCNPGWSGDSCAVPPPCTAEVDCSGHGITTDKDKTNGCVCTCTDGFTGRSCAVPPPCTPADCSNHGTTTDADKTDGCVCSCTGGFTGDDCSTPPPCDAVTDCHGHGDTSDLDKTDGCTCECTGGFTGISCGVPPRCTPADCHFHGFSHDMDKTDGCSCFCMSGYTGDDCSVPPPCVAGTAVFQAAADDEDPYAYGAYADEADDDHNAGDCNGHGTTTDMDRTDGCDCVCTDDYTGRDCSEPPVPCSDLHPVRTYNLFQNDDGSSGWCRSADGQRVTGYFGFQKTADECKSACDADPACFGYGTEDDGPKYCYVHADTTNIPAGFYSFEGEEDSGGHAADIASVDPDPDVTCYTVEQSAPHFMRVRGLPPSRKKTNGLYQKVEHKQEWKSLTNERYLHIQDGSWIISLKDGGSQHVMASSVDADSHSLPSQVPTWQVNIGGSMAPAATMTVSVETLCNGHGTTDDQDSADGCVCTCTGGFTGNNCGVPPPCIAAVDCGGHGNTTDLDKSDGCDCECDHGWTGKSCRVPPPCRPLEDCSGHGATSDKDKTDGCVCTCAGGWTGVNCAIPPPCVAATDCSGHGTTDDLDKTNGCDCDCTDGYSGDSCAVPPPCVAKVDCSGHGTTTDKDKTDGCICECTQDYTGDNCATPPPCTEHDCSDHGTTTDVDKTDGCVCTCTNDFTGDNCAVPPIPCTGSINCNGHGTTDDVDSVDGCACECIGGFTGQNCGIPPPCKAAVDCSGHGSTTDKDKTDGCDCECTDDYSSDDCSVPPPCDAVVDCSDHGTTTDLDKTDGCVCECTDGFTGDSCAIPPPCKPDVDCSGHGDTNDLDRTDDCDCICQDGFTGDDCETPPPCSEASDCSGHGTTHDLDKTDGCDCNCHDGFTGDDCATPPPCDAAVDCSGHGTTDDLDKTDGCDCDCTDYWSGDDCSSPPIPCDDLGDCNGHGHTNDKVSEDGCDCKCTDGYTGKNCKIPPPCVALKDCHGHGTTTDLDKTDGCDCVCKSGFTGDSCNVPPPCDAAAVDGCNGHGTTTDLDKTDGCDCTCDMDWSGDSCETYSCRELFIPGGCNGLDGKEFWMYVEGYESGILNKWLSFNWDGHWTLARYDLKTDAMPLLFQATDTCNTYKLQNKWTGAQADDKWLGYSECGNWIQATSDEDSAATFELVAECNETLSGPQHRDYRGCQSKTRSGRTCQKWTAQTPHAHNDTDAAYPNRGLGTADDDHNHCRNPDGGLTIWCYTTDPDPKYRWEYCDALPQSEFKMQLTSDPSGKHGYLSYAEKDHTDGHWKGSIQADYTAASAMTFNLHRDCPPAPEAETTAMQMLSEKPPAPVASLTEKSPVMQSLKENPFTIGCFMVAATFAAVSGMHRSRKNTGDLYVSLAEQETA